MTEKKMEKNKEDEAVSRKFERSYGPAMSALITVALVFYIFSIAEVWPFSSDPWHDPWFFVGIGFLVVSSIPAVWSVWKDRN